MLIDNVFMMLNIVMRIGKGVSGGGNRIKIGFVLISRSGMKKINIIVVERSDHDQVPYIRAIP
jgi:hypothetical protein